MYIPRDYLKFESVSPAQEYPHRVTSSKVRSELETGKTKQELLF
jgi:hypothetical protein